MASVFPVQSSPLWPVEGGEGEYPIHRIFCVGRNYAAHAVEMGKDPDRDPPFFFTKWPESYVPSGSTVAYPVSTSNYHHEVELVVAMSGGGGDIAAADALDHVFGYAVGLDMTRRDLQLKAREQGRPWDTGKNFEESAPLGPLFPASRIGHPDAGRIEMRVNADVRQEADLKDLIWSVPEIIEHLSRYYALRAGDIIMTGTPAGVAAVDPGDELVGRIDGLGEVRITIAGAG